MKKRRTLSRTRVWVPAIAVLGMIAVAAAPGQAASSLQGVDRSGLIRLSQQELLSNATAKLEPGEECDIEVDPECVHEAEGKEEILDSAQSFATPRTLPANFG